MDIGCEIADRCTDTPVQCAAIGEMAAETHACCADAAVAGREGEKERYGGGSVGVVGGEFLDM